MSLALLKTADTAPPVLESKLSPSLPRPGLVNRVQLVERIVNTPLPVTAICAPTGYGKTTLLAQVAAALDRPVAWISLDVSDNDPTLLLAAIAAAIDPIVPVDPLVFDQLLSPEAAIGHEVRVRLLNSLARGPAFALILDDVHVVRAQASVAALGVLCEQLPAGVRLIVAAREVPQLPLARLRAHGRLLELGSADLALSAVEARQLLQAAHVTLDVDAFESLYERTEGWAAGLYLAAAGATTAADPNRLIRQFAGDDRAVSAYLAYELLDQQSPERLAFLLRTSVLERLSPELCDAVLDCNDSAAMLAELEQWTGFLVPLDRRREWYRYHHLFREVQLAALLRREPGRVLDLHLRASRWYERNGMPSEAIEHAFAGHDRRRAAELLALSAQPLFNAGQQTTVRRWLESFSDADLEAYPRLAAAAAWILGLVGERAEARRYIDIVERAPSAGPYPLGERTSQSSVDLLRAGFAWEGVSQMHALAERAFRLEPPGSGPHEQAALYLGVNLFLRGRHTAAQDPLHEAASLGASAATSAVAAVGLLALIDLEAHRIDEADTRVRGGLGLIDDRALDGYMAAGLLLATGACVDVERGDHALARYNLEQVVALLPRASAVPWLSILLGILGGRVALALGDLDLAETLLVQARRELARYPDAGMLPHYLTREERALEAARGGAGVLVEPLTEAELRVLELAPTYLTLEEIGRSLSISRNTVKTHLKVIYGKLNVGSRGEAVERARALGLIGRRAGRG
jgi:LuxR family maltose regulon positive regulatory protein